MWEQVCTIPLYWWIIIWCLFGNMVARVSRQVNKDVDAELSQSCILAIFYWIMWPLGVIIIIDSIRLPPIASLPDRIPRVYNFDTKSENELKEPTSLESCGCGPCYLDRSGAQIIDVVKDSVNNALQVRYMEKGMIKVDHIRYCGREHLVDAHVKFINVSQHNKYKKRTESQKEEKSMLKETLEDVKGFVREHRSVLYTIAIVALVDHFMFKGALRSRLQALIEKMLSKAEDKVSNG